MWQQISKEDKTIIYANQSGEICRLELLYEHKELGKFYIFNNATTIPYQRKHVLDLIIQNETLGASHKDLDDLLGQIQQLAKESNKSFEIYNLATVMRNRINNTWTFHHAELLLAANFIVHENENISYFDQQTAEDKINTWSKDKDMLAFFLSKLSGWIKPLTNNLASLIQKATEELKTTQQLPTLSDALKK